MNTTFRLHDQRAAGAIAMQTTRTSCIHPVIGLLVIIDFRYEVLRDSNVGAALWGATLYVADSVLELPNRWSAMSTYGLSFDPVAEGARLVHSHLLPDPNDLS
ncbi:hypothetical protein [Paucibacter sp. XJ19-41]|uniref:hypothetical protein n=1 Tax=Paucibacter sp. XJ19-41 TaxID=2927824 RepID=UPI00234A53A3|nr:hypothetical protein [Paucibacter sp. XJ19-41]MDC6168110.1 hypothetical protein [Paucibacter sp. XJ19-41]